MSRIRLILPVLLLPAAAIAQTAPATPTVAPRNPGGYSAGAVQGNQGQMNHTVGSISNHLLNSEKNRPRLPNQAPSPSQTLPGGTAAGQSPDDHAPPR